MRRRAKRPGREERDALHPGGGTQGESERERVGHEANHRGVGERGEPPLLDERPYDEHVYDLADGLKQVGAERWQCEAREVSSRTATQEVYLREKAAAAIVPH